MKDKLRLLALLAVFLPYGLHAQDFILGDFQGSSPGESMHKAGVVSVVQRNSGVQTFAPFPLREDFSYDSLRPVSTIWDVAFSGAALDHVPGISTQKGLNPPTKGVCTFDGATFSGDLYVPEFSTGEADSLTSLPFDLSTYSASDSIYLSFFVQRGGRNDLPETQDSLILYADVSGNRDYERIWGMGGTTVADAAFMKQMIPLTDARFFHGNFRFKFVNVGSQNGEYDVWHLDLVEMRANRSISETQAMDVSPVQVVVSALAPYSSMPMDHFVQRDYSFVPQVLVANAGASSANGGVGFTISDTSGLNGFSGTVSQNTSGLAFTGSSSLNVSPSGLFGDQSGNFSQPGSYSLSTIVSAGGDPFHANDTLWTHAGIDSVLAYDDGICDAAYGLTAARSFCQAYKIPSADTLTAVWIYFTPYLYVSPQGVSYPLENKQFRLSVWDTLGVDSFLIQTSQGMTIDYGNGLNAFQRFPLSNPLVVDTMFWVGLRQIDAIPVGIGFDRNFDQTTVYYEASNGSFVQSTNQGTLMIRPEFARAASQSVAAQGNSEKEIELQVFPNPGGTMGRKLQLHGSEALRDVRVEVFSLDGRQILEMNWEVPSSILELPSRVFGSRGVYVLRVSAVDGERNVLQQSELLIVE